MKYSSFIVGLCTLFVISACGAPSVAITSCTSQVYYPGRQEVEPYQEIILKTGELEESVTLDSLVYGNQTVLLRPNQQSFYGQAEGTSFSSKGVLYYSKKNKVFTQEIDSILKLDPLYLP
ncbi:MAG: hypothetical protein NXI10_03915 [bacterium]|nr:hypothetical protein [bacterium]